MSHIGYFLFLGAAVVSGLAVVLFLLQRIVNTKVDNDVALHIARSIAQGAMTFLKEEYKIISMVALIVAGLLWYSLGILSAVAFLCGALLSSATGFIGMRAATLANVRTTMAAKNNGEHAAFSVAFFGGGVMGFAVATFGLLGLIGIFYFFHAHTNFIPILTSFGLGGSLVAFFARVGGGIFTKSADVGADLVGKLEAGIPEDDPRNPAVIADNVGDCVGDTAGMGADIFESYVGAIVSCIILSIANAEYNSFLYHTLPLMLAAIGLFSSIVGLCSNKISKGFLEFDGLNKKHVPVCEPAPGFFISFANYFKVAFIKIGGSEIEIAKFG